MVNPSTSLCLVIFLVSSWPLKFLSDGFLTTFLSYHLHFDFMSGFFFLYFLPSRSGSVFSDGKNVQVCLSCCYYTQANLHMRETIRLNFATVVSLRSVEGFRLYTVVEGSRPLRSKNIRSALIWVMRAWPAPEVTMTPPQPKGARKRETLEHMRYKNELL